jgi:hypothetical protein
MAPGRYDEPTPELPSLRHSALAVDPTHEDQKGLVGEVLGVFARVPFRFEHPANHAQVVHGHKE